jgi:hypothetical protein
MTWLRLASALSLSFLVSASAFAQMGVPSSPNPTGSPVSTAQPARGRSGEAAAIAGALAVGGVIGYLANHHKHRQSHVLGCVAPSREGSQVTDEKDKKTYTLLAAEGLRVSPGERLKLYGKKIHASGKLIFVARQVGEDYGACTR